MKKRLSRRAVLFALAVAALFALLSCATPPARIGSLEIKDQPSKIAASVGLYLSEDTRAYVLNDNFDRVLEIGAGLETNAKPSLEKVFKAVFISKPGDKAVKTVLEISVDANSKLVTDFGLMSDRTVKLSLKATLRNSAGKTTWEVTVSGEGTKANPAGWMAGLWRPYAVQMDSQTLGLAGDEALKECLVALNAQIVKNKKLFP
jgi:hypothetical protein